MSDDIETYLDAATAHAERSSDPAIEVGDLQGMVRAAWRLLDASGRAGFLSDPEVVEIHASALGEDPDDAPAPADAEALIASARQHGEDSEPDMEPGDLQVHLRSAHRQLTPEGKAAFVASPEAVATMEAGAPAPRR